MRSARGEAPGAGGRAARRAAAHPAGLSQPRGKSGRALTAWLTRDAARDPESPSSWHRIPVGRGVELHIETAHPLARLGPDDAAVAEAVRQALAKLLPSANA